MPEIRLSRLAASLLGSEILKIAADVRAHHGAAGRRSATSAWATSRRRSSASPSRSSAESSTGCGVARRTIRRPTGSCRCAKRCARCYRRELGLDPALASVIVTSGSRPGIYATYRALVDPGDRVVYPTPSWNNPYYVQLVGAEGVPVPCGPESRFMPTRDVAGAGGARRAAARALLAAESSRHDVHRGDAAARSAISCSRRTRGAARRASALRDVRSGLLDAHLRRRATRASGAGAAGDGAVHDLHRRRVEVARGNGIRVGWIVAPRMIAGPMSALSATWARGHRRPSRARSRRFSRMPTRSRVPCRHDARVRERLDALYDGLIALRDDGLPVDVIAPEGAIYLSASFAFLGRVTPDGTRLDGRGGARVSAARGGHGRRTAACVRRGGRDGWLRLSAGAVSPGEIERVLPRLRTALLATRGV